MLLAELLRTSSPTEQSLGTAGDRRLYFGTVGYQLPKSHPPLRPKAASVFTKASVGLRDHTTLLLC